MADNNNNNNNNKCWRTDGNTVDANDWLGTRNNAPLIIRTENGGGVPNPAAEAMRITAAADGRRVGIGTATPSQKLTLGSGNVLLPNANAGIDGNLYFGGITDVGQTGLRLFGGLVNGAIPAGFIDVRTTDPNDGLRIRVDAGAGGTERMRVAASGNVGIGTTTPTDKLDVAGNIKLRGSLGFTNATTPMIFIFESGVANPERPVISHSPAFPTWGLSYRDPDDTMIFQSAGAPVMALGLGSGNVGIALSNPAFRLDVAGQAHATNFVSTSDARFKTNVKELTNVLDKLEKIRAVSFQWNELYESLGRSTGRAEIGVIAQEVEAIFPELVTAWGDESYKGVDYGRLSGVLIEAVKELKAQNEVLRSRIEALEGV
jgi:Chaperone of endosialidase